jgi:ABC-2 type transport system ATP-binding protein
MSDTVIAIEQVSHRYRERSALVDLNLGIRAGSLVGLLGPNGSGKSTLLGLLATRLALQSGKVSILGLDLATQVAGIRGRLGVVFQRPSLDRRLTVRENLYYGGQMYGLTGNPLSQRIGQVLTQFRLDDRRDSVVETLSGGLARRVELAKGLLHRPEVILLDEPSTGLDPAARRDLWNALSDLRAQGVTTLVSTHLASEGEQCDEVHILHQGKLVASGAPSSLQQSVGQDMLAIQAVDPGEFLAVLRSEFQLAPQVHGSQLRIECPSGADFMAQLLQRHRQQILSLTLSRPSLEDVFFSKTGQMFESAPEESPSLWPARRR